jgi:hypothetical protein
MNVRLVKLGLLSALLGSGVLLAGCSRSGGNADASPPPPQANVQTTPPPQKPMGGGGVPDRSIHPAPPGVQTGLEGGRK